MIYFLRRIESDGAIKIGFTSSFKFREYALSREHGKLELLGMLEGGRKEEQALHRQFTSARITPRGEWFRATEELLTFIKNDTVLDLPKSVTETRVMVNVSDDTKGALYALAGRLQMNTGRRMTLDDALIWLFETVTADGTA